MRDDFKKGDLVVATGSQGEIQTGKTYKIKSVDGDFVHLQGCKCGHFKSYFKKKINFPKIKELDALSLTNSRADINAEKIQEIIKVINQISETLKEIY